MLISVTLFRKFGDARGNSHNIQIVNISIPSTPSRMHFVIIPNPEPKMRTNNCLQLPLGCALSCGIWLSSGYPVPHFIGNSIFL